MEEITPDRLNRLYKNLTDISEAQELRLFDEKVSKITNLNLVPRIKSLNLSYNQIAEIEGLKHCPDLKEVNLSHNKITSVSSFAFEKNKFITSLDLSHNHIEKIAASSVFLKLQVLNLEYNRLSTIEFVGNCKELRILNISNNKIKRIDPVDYLTKLEELYVRKNQITEISERNLKNHQNLSQVDISFNQLKSISFAQNLPSLMSMDCSHNNVKKIDFNREMECLENLDLSHNEFVTLAELPKFAPNLVTLDISSNPNLDSFDLELLTDLVELREINFEDNFFSSRGLEDDLHRQFPYIEAINNRQVQRPGYRELDELEKMKEDPELALLDSDIKDPLSIVHANDKYDLAEVKKELESKSMNSKKYDNTLTNEGEYKAWMENYQNEMMRLRAQHQRIIAEKGYEVEGEANLEDVDRKLSQSMARLSQTNEEIKSSEPSKRDSVNFLVTQEKRAITPITDKPDFLTKPKPPTPTKGLLIRSQKNFRKSDKGSDLQPESEKKQLTKTMTEFKSGPNDSEIKPSMMGTSDDFKRRLEVEKENFRKSKDQAKKFNIKDLVSSNASKNRHKIMNAINMSRDFKGSKNKDKEELADVDIQNE